jgi:two-component system nitrogen regulation sensor histidine kinase NtrY
MNAVLIFVFYFWFICLLTWVFQYWQFQPDSTNKTRAALAIVVGFTLLRLVWINNPFSESINAGLLFSPEVFAHSALFPSLGDLVINGTLLVFYAHIVGSIMDGLSMKRVKERSSGIWIILVLITLVIISGINDLLEGLVLNSKISFNLERAFELDFFSLIGLFGIGLLFLAFYVWLRSIIHLMKRGDIRLSILVLIAATLFALYAVFQVLTSNYNLVDALWALPLIISIGIWSWFRNRTFFLGISLVNLAIYAFFAAHVFNEYNVIRENNVRKVLGERLQQVQDPILELEFLEIKRDIQNLLKHHSDSLWYAFSEPNKQRIIDLFSEDWYRFKKEVSIYRRSLGEENQDWIKRRLGIDTVYATADPDLFFYSGKNAGQGYAFELPISVKKDSLLVLFGDLNEIPEPNQKGFPGLVSDDRIKLGKSNDYLYARYFENRRQLSNDEEFFPVNLASWQPDLETTGIYPYGKYSVMFLPQQYGFRWLIAREIPGIRQQITVFSYMFLFLGVFYFLWLVAERFLLFPNLVNFSLRMKIQIILIALVLIIISVFAYVVLDQINDQLSRQNRDQIAERLNSITIELEHKTGSFTSINAIESGTLQAYLDKFSEVFYSDITLYDTAGSFVASSSSILWEKGLLSNQIHPTAYHELEFQHKNQFVQQEHIGSFTYLSGYKPLYNDNGKKMGILNVPYFTRQNEFRKEVNRFLLVLTNIFVLITGFSVIVAIYVSNWITNPLKILQTSLTQLNLIRVNQPIQYKGNDEIANMVQVYNSKVKELEEMADRIAQSERESAWREMARQVAHEIKNPLTPMRLSIQHYQRLLIEKPEEAREKAPMLMNSLIEQIDNLAHIAGEFSQFARISLTSRSDFDLAALVREITSLFETNENISIKSQTVPDKAMIKADKGQIIRMLNNLIQNAIQAIEQNKEGFIEVVLSEKENGYELKIKDNGKGIEKELHEKIFSPNFTTKSKGMGLGLAIVKKIALNHRGNISFETKRNQGSTFTIFLPKE